MRSVLLGIAAFLAFSVGAYYHFTGNEVAHYVTSGKGVFLFAAAFICSALEGKE